MNVRKSNKSKIMVRYVLLPVASAKRDSSFDLQGY